jgi:hypothetical protein
MGVFFLSNGCKDPIIEDTDLLTADDELNLAKDSLNVKVFSFYEEKNSRQIPPAQRCWAA